MRYSLTSDTSNWMSAIDDNKSFAHISIPGTHDSCARQNASGQMIDIMIATQYERCTISQQLLDGIRYLDIRCCVSDGVFTIHHGKTYLNINFGDVLKECESFLKNHCTEAIIMRIKQENSSVPDSRFIEIFNTRYKYYHHIMYAESSIPTLGKVRGKIVILSNVKSLPGIPWNLIKVQDDYRVIRVIDKLPKVHQYI